MSGQSLNLSQTPAQRMEPNSPHPSDQHFDDSLGTKISLGAVLTKQGKYDEAETVLKDVLEKQRQRGQGEVNQDMLATMNNLAAVYHHQRRFSEAETLNRQVLELDEQFNGSTHPSTITSMHNLAHLLSDQGKWDDAQALQQRAVETSERVLDPEKPDTMIQFANNLGELGSIMLRQHNLAEAETVLRKALGLQRKGLREGHPDTASTARHLAIALRKQGKTEEADELQRESAPSRTDVQETSDTSKAARVPAKLDHYDELEDSLQEKVKVSTETTGRDSRETRRNLNQLGVVLIDNGKFKEAEDTFRSVLAMGTV